MHNNSTNNTEFNRKYLEMFASAHLLCADWRSFIGIESKRQQTHTHTVREKKSERKIDMIGINETEGDEQSMSMK